MTRTAVDQGFERYLSALVEETYSAFDVTAVLRGSQGSRSRVVSKLLNNSRPLERHVVRPKLREYQRTLRRQFDSVLDYAADTDGAFEKYADEVLARDRYWASLQRDVRRDRRDEIRERLLSCQRAFGDAVVAADSDAFWPAVVEAYDR